jgi:hypothetical protein
MSDASTPIGPLTQKVLEYAGTIERTVPAAKDAAFTDAAWAPLASLFATDSFERASVMLRTDRSFTQACRLDVRCW